ncbi:MAG TPA: transposase [Candidatus Limnocylindrales bacterium]
MVRHPKTLIDFMQMYPTEEDCRRAIFEHRWPQGFRCRRCGHEHAWYLRGRGLAQGATPKAHAGQSRQHLAGAALAVVLSIDAADLAQAP